MRRSATERLSYCRNRKNLPIKKAQIHLERTEGQRVSSNKDESPPAFGVTEFDDLDRRKKITREDGTRWNYGYNDKGEVTSGVREKTTSPNTAVPGWSHVYSFDGIGNRVSATTNERVSIYTPNNLNQITSRTIPRAFDVIGKASSSAAVSVNSLPAIRLDEYFYKELSAGSGPVHVPYSVVATGAGTTTRGGGKFLPATPEAFAHDFDGNLTSDGRFTYTWDAENRLAAMETHATIPLPARRKLAFSYDAMGRRIRKTVWHGTGGGGWQLHHQFDFVHELGGWNILAERSGGSADSFIRTYAWGTDLSGGLSGAGGVGGMLFCNVHTSGKTIAYGSDLNGNVTLLVDTTSGQAAASYDYGPFGELLRQSGEYASLNPFRFSTKYTDDETGMIDYGVRYYIPATGGWLSKDPIEEFGGLNLYGYCHNDSVNRWDALGFLDSTAALEHYKGGSSTAKPMDFSEIDTSKVKPSEFPRMKDAIRDFKRNPKARTVRIKWKNKDDNLPFTTSGDQALFLGDISLKLEGDFFIKSDCTWEFHGPLKSFDDWYDFNASTHRGPLGELMTTVGRNTPGKPYWIEIRGSKQLKETGSKSSHPDVGEGGSRGWY